MKAMILAAGKGTRLGKLTEDKPKALVLVNGKPMIEHVIENLKCFGISEIIINVHHFAGQIIDFLKQNKNFGIRIEVSDERDALLDTGGGLMKASYFFDDGKPFLVHNVDVLSKTDLHRLEMYHSRIKSLATLVVKKRDTARYLLIDKNQVLCGWINKAKGEKIVVRYGEKLTEAAFSGIQMLNPEIFRVCTKKGKFSLTDLYLDIAEDHKIVVYNDNALWFDIGKPERIGEAEKIFFGE
ncbi:MAG TPA: nucleotidyltransferase family protein [Bacteroidales bacterium]|nr:nucleotidyltransferase family protein [Bacteroidales bacterium]